MDILLTFFALVFNAAITTTIVIVVLKLFHPYIKKNFGINEKEQTLSKMQADISEMREALSEIKVAIKDMCEAQEKIKQGREE